MKKAYFTLLIALIFLAACTAQTSTNVKQEQNTGVAPAVVNNNTVKTPTRTECTLDTKYCPDGTIVYRNPALNCNFDQCITMPETNFEASYANGKLTYTAIIQKPTPCTKLSIRQLQTNTAPVQIIIDVTTQEPSQDTVCAQVVTPEVINGYVMITPEPGSMKVVLDGTKLYETSKFG